jgi:hypothetical protein
VYVSPLEIVEGALTGGFRVFIMPHSRAVSEAEAREIRRFVQEGGVVIADLRPGTLNGHGTPQPESLLTDLFPTDQPDTVTPLGKGKAILIGDLLTGYARAHRDQFGWKRLPLEKSQRLATLLREEAGVSPQVKVVPLPADRIPPTEITRFQCGDIEFVGLLREYFLYDNEEYPVRLEFPRKAHLYDVMTGEYLGHTDRIETKISCQAKLYALSPYRVSSLELKAPATVTAGAVMPVQVAVQAAGNAQPSRHAFRLEVVAPGGKRISHYAQNLLAEEGVARAEIPWALNDRSGKYTVSVRDAMSGVTAQQVVTLRLPNGTRKAAERD